MWVEAVLSSRGGAYAFARGDHHGMHAYLLSRTLGLAHAPSLDAFWVCAHGAADALACLAEAGLLHGTLPAQEGLLVWLERCLAAYDARAELQAAALHVATEVMDRAY